MIESAEQFVTLRKSDEPEEYRRAAHDNATDEVWLEVIAKYPEMRAWVAHNKTVPVHILRLLAGDAEPTVRATVAAVRRLDPATFELLASDPDAGVRGRIALNAKAPQAVLARLANDSISEVAASAQRRLALRR
jgi:hypothetical protein